MFKQYWQNRHARREAMAQKRAEKKKARELEEQARAEKEAAEDEAKKQFRIRKRREITSAAYWRLIYEKVHELPHDGHDSSYSIVFRAIKDAVDGKYYGFGPPSIDLYSAANLAHSLLDARARSGTAEQDPAEAARKVMEFCRGREGTVIPDSDIDELALGMGLEPFIVHAMVHTLIAARKEYDPGYGKEEVTDNDKNNGETE